jgi:hypothetical protein
MDRSDVGGLQGRGILGSSGRANPRAAVVTELGTRPQRRVALHALDRGHVCAALVAEPGALPQWSVAGGAGATGAGGGHVLFPGACGPGYVLHG